MKSRTCAECGKPMFPMPGIACKGTPIEEIKGEGRPGYWGCSYCDMMIVDMDEVRTTGGSNHTAGKPTQSG